MTQPESKRPQGGKIALIAAGVLALGAIGYAVTRDREEEPDLAADAVEASPADPIAALRQRAAANPNDADTLLALGDALVNEGQFAEAIDPYDRATRAAPNSAQAWSSLGEARVYASQRDPLPASALEAFRRAASIDPKNPRARYFLGVEKDLGGDHAGAIADWLALLADTPPGAPWQADLVRTIEQVGKINKIDVANRIAVAQKRGAVAAPSGHPALPGPTQQDIAAASAIPPGEQRTMAEGMVARLEARLKSEPANVDGWIMLMRSRMTLGEPAKASQALKDGVGANPAQAETLRAAAAELGVR